MILEGTTNVIAQAPRIPKVEFLTPKDNFFHHSKIDGLTFSYEGIHTWEASPLKEYKSAAEADYPPTQLLMTGKGEHPHMFPAYDMIIQEEGKPPLLFTAAHNRLLYECVKQKIPPDKNRVLFYFDNHDDFALGTPEKAGLYRPDDVDIGNWGSVGAIKDYWGKLALVRGYDFGQPARKIDIQLSIKANGQRLEVPFVEFPFVNPPPIEMYLQQLVEKNQPFITSMDADQPGGWIDGVTRYKDEPFTYTHEGVLRKLLQKAISRKAQLIHFTPSPAFCPEDQASKIWDIVREQYSHI